MISYIWISDKQYLLKCISNTAWDILTLKYCSLFFWNSNIIGCPVFYVATLLDAQKIIVGPLFSLGPIMICHPRIIKTCLQSVSIFKLYQLLGLMSSIRWVTTYKSRRMSLSVLLCRKFVCNLTMAKLMTWMQNLKGKSRNKSW